MYLHPDDMIHDNPIPIHFDISKYNQDDRYESFFLEHLKQYDPYQKARLRFICEDGSDDLLIVNTVTIREVHAIVTQLLVMIDNES